ncbi:hypothetical protein RHMOL_Rhmol11G0063600 [Rhododendron molle]|uniref:Uncharacterized protein n=1 Tax=Rhododendron molle TaxID=49168 RepID=A0ACC0LQE9_RHOML|nr:hypothetical protein RHMOL_Rhmol11G0063600 [Rhododendron molle]
MGLSSLQQVTAAIRMLASGMAANQCDEHLKVAETTTTKSMKDFCTAINQIFAGTNNDLNVLDNSHLFDHIVSGKALACNFIVNGHTYTMDYYLSDGIYPKWATLIQTISQPVIAKHKHFAQLQEAVRKDVEWAFGVLQARFAIVKGSVRLWDREECGLIMKTCIILHNMIVENEEDPEEWAPPEDEACESVVYNRDANLLRSNRINRIKSMTNEVTHSQLKLDLIEHLWNRRGDGDQ